ncbi:MAG: hypothetical protein [Microviridae sp.]|nr:MAG: hypothetical protein [Microviridae sp.]
MYNKKTSPKGTTIKVNESYEGETIEQKVVRITQNKEPIKDGAPRVYTERKEGVRPDMDIRTDRFEVAVEAMDKVTRAKLAKRDGLGKEAKEGMKKESKTGGESSSEGGKTADNSGNNEGKA